MIYRLPVVAGNVRSILCCALLAVACGSEQPQAGTMEQLVQGEMQLYFGEVHSHSNQSFDANRQGAVDPQATFAYARDVAEVDFAAITDHAETIDEDEWPAYLEALRLYNDSGHFVTIGGWEWTSAIHGHKNVYFRGEPPDQPIGSSGLATAGHEVVRGPDVLWRTLQQQGLPFLSAPHHPAESPGIYSPTDWDFADAQAQPLVEIYSKHGSSDVAGCPEPVVNFTPSGSVSSALSRWLEAGDPGYKLGIIAGSDDHSSRPGCTAETAECTESAHQAPLFFKYYSAGLTGVWATALTREAVFDAMKAKRVYATSGPRIRLELRARLGLTSRTMGQTLRGAGLPRSVELSGRVQGDTAEVDLVEIYLDETQVASVAPSTEGDFSWSSPPLRGRHFFRVKAYQRPTPAVDGGTVRERAWSSPIWLEN